MHFLDGLVGEDLALDTTKSYLRQAVYIGRSVTNWYKIAWRYSKHRRGKCPARASTEGNYVVKLIGEDNH